MSRSMEGIPATACSSPAAVHAGRSAAARLRAPGEMDILCGAAKHGRSAGHDGSIGGNRHGKRFPVKQQMLLRRRDTFQALQGIDLALYSGQTLGVVGESGSGKSTLGEIFGDLQQPTSGIVRYKGQDIRSLGEKEYRRFRRNVQYIFQNPKES